MMQVSFTNESWISGYMLPLVTIHLLLSWYWLHKYLLVCTNSWVMIKQDLLEHYHSKQFSLIDKKKNTVAKVSVGIIATIHKELWQIKLPPLEWKTWYLKMLEWPSKQTSKFWGKEASEIEKWKLGFYHGYDPFDYYHVSDLVGHSRPDYCSLI